MKTVNFGTIPLMNQYKTIGIIGGQGPVSTADFYMRIAKYYQDKLGARYVRDFPPMIIFSVPTPDLVERVEDEEMTFSIIANATKRLEQDGSDFIIIACNSLQHLIGKLQVLVKIPIISMAPIVADYVEDKGYKTVGILATDTTIRKKVYDSCLEEKGVKLVKPNEEDLKSVEQVILNEIGGRVTTKDTKKLRQVIGNLQKGGVDAIMLACTELPLVINQTDVDIPLINCNELYVYEAAKLSSNI